jgi:hypothetical protein
MPSRRGLTAVTVALVLLAGCGQSETEKALAKYDPSEVQLLRDQAKRNNIELNDRILLSTLQTRDDCRTIRAALRALTEGQTTGDAMTRFTALPAENRKRGQVEQADYFQTMVDKALLGDPGVAKTYHEQTCADVP